MENRIKIGLEFLKDSQPFNIDNLQLSLINYNVLTIVGWSKYLNFSSLTVENSTTELNDIKNTFLNMLKTSISLKNFTENKSLQYILCYDDGGKASIEICCEKDGIIIWNL